MATLTVRQVRNETQKRLREAAARNGRSMEAEVRHLIERTFGESDGLEPLAPGETWVDEVIRLSRPGVELNLPPRTASWHERPVFGAD
jgi:plasmid stability protein